MEEFLVAFQKAMNGGLLQRIVVIMLVPLLGLLFILGLIWAVLKYEW